MLCVRKMCVLVLNLIVPALSAKVKIVKQP
jgi:hypothetical protein